MPTVRWGVGCDKVNGSKRTALTVALINPNTSAVVKALTQYNNEPTGFYRALDIPTGVHSLAVNGAVVADPFFQSMPFYDPAAVGHAHAAGNDRLPTEGIWTAVLYAGHYRYTFTTRSQYVTGSLKVYLNGVWLAPTELCPNAAERSEEGGDNTTFYVHLPANKNYNGQLVTATEYILTLDYQTTT